MIHNSNPKR